MSIEESAHVMMKEKLVGKVLTGYTLSPDRTTLTLAIEGGSITLQAEGDCCSETWIESLDNPTALQGTILSVEDIDMPDRGDITTKHRPNVECVSYYGLKIVTNHGHCVLDYRNDSNGYYGGWIECVEPEATRGPTTPQGRS